MNLNRSQMLLVATLLLISVFIMGRTARGDAHDEVHTQLHVGKDDWCLMMWTPPEIRPNCIRTFDTYNWCMFDLSTMVDEYALTNITFDCNLEYNWRALVR